VPGDVCELCGHSHFSNRGTVRWQVSGLRCPRYIQLALELWDDGIRLGTPNYKPQSLRHGKCGLKETGICVWQRQLDKGGIACTSPDVKPALWSLDRNPMDFYLQQCPTCKRRYVYNHKNRMCPNRKCSNKRPWSLQLVDKCRFYARGSKAPEKPIRSAKPPQAAHGSGGTLRSQQTKPRAAVYAELKACMYELAATHQGFVIDPSTLERLAGIALRRAEERSAQIRAAKESRPVVAEATS
jgi:hypothetical protein